MPKQGRAPRQEADSIIQVVLVELDGNGREVRRSTPSTVPLESVFEDVIDYSRPTFARRALPALGKFPDALALAINDEGAPQQYAKVYSGTPAAVRKLYMLLLPELERHSIVPGVGKVSDRSRPGAEARALIAGMVEPEVTADVLRVIKTLQNNDFWALMALKQMSPETSLLELMRSDADFAFWHGKAV